MSRTESTESLRPGTATSGRTDTPSESNFPMSIYRPRNRPHDPQNRFSHADTVSTVSDVPEMQEQHQVSTLGSQRRPQGLVTPPTPRLRPARRSQAGLSAWKAPSFDNEPLFGRQNRQILLFCLGFICPLGECCSQMRLNGVVLILVLAWILASFLPLPPDPELSTPAPSFVDVERQLAGIVTVDERSFRKAQWWRNLNRILAAVGTLLIGVIVSTTSLQFGSDNANACVDCISNPCIQDVITSLMSLFSAIYPDIYNLIYHFGTRQASPLASHLSPPSFSATSSNISPISLSTASSRLRTYTYTISFTAIHITLNPLSPYLDTPAIPLEDHSRLLMLPTLLMPFHQLYYYIYVTTRRLMRQFYPFLSTLYNNKTVYAFLWPGYVDSLLFDSEMQASIASPHILYKHDFQLYIGWENGI